MMSFGRLLHLRRIVTRRGDFGGGKLAVVFFDTLVGIRFSSRLVIPATLRVGGRRFDLIFLFLLLVADDSGDVGDFGGGMHSQFVRRLRLLSVGSSCKHMISLVTSASLSSASVNSLLTLLLLPGLLAKEDRREDFPVKQGEY